MVVEAQYQIRVTLDDKLDPSDVEFLHSLVAKEKALAEAGVLANGDNYKEQGRYVGRSHNAGICKAYQSLHDFEDRMRFFEALTRNVLNEELRLNAIIDNDQHHHCHLTPTLIKKLNGGFRKGCEEQTREFYSQLKEYKTLRHLRTYVDERLGPAK